MYCRVQYYPTSPHNDVINLTLTPSLTPLPAHKIDKCKPNTCRNEGKCVFSEELKHVYCICKDHTFTGVYCQHKNVTQGYGRERGERRGKGRGRISVGMGVFDDLDWPWLTSTLLRRTTGSRQPWDVQGRRAGGLLFRYQRHHFRYGHLVFRLLSRI